MRIIDVGTGSGCIALALASELPRATILATDISWSALQVARRNAERLGMDDRVRFVQADLLEGFLPESGGTFDLVVANPPYVGRDETDSVQREVREFEPRLAWGGLSEPVAVYRRLIRQAALALKPGGYLVLEIGYSMGESVPSLFGREWSDVSGRPDLAGIPRVVTGRNRSRD